MIKLTREHFTLELCGTSYYLYCRLQEDTNEGIEVCIEPLFGGYYVALYELSSRILIMEKDYLKWSTAKALQSITGLISLDTGTRCTPKPLVCIIGGKFMTPTLEPLK